MTVEILLAPAGRGKTAHVVAAIRELPPLSPVRVLVPDQMEAVAFRGRLARAGGALGVVVQTFYGLYADVLALAAGAGARGPGESDQGLARLLPAVRHRLIQRLAERLSAAGELPYYAPACRAPGFARMLGDLFGELKRARVFPDELTPVLAGREPRLSELARLYAAYQAWLLDTGWVDADGQGWLAAIALEEHPELLSDLALLAVDSFDEFNPTQLRLLRLLADRAATTLITLTGDPENPERLAHRRFARARTALAEAFGPDPLTPFPTREGGTPLPSLPRGGAGGEVAPDPLAHLEENLFVAGARLAAAGDAVTFLEAQNRVTEAREALRWLKARVVRDGVALADVAVVARDVTPYRPFLEEVAAEFGMPVRFASGASLAASPAIAALLNLLALPLQPVNWAPRALLDALTNPYFDWSGCGLAGWRKAAADENAPLPPQPFDKPFDKLRTQLRAGSWGEAAFHHNREAGEAASPQGWGVGGAISSDAADAGRLYDVALVGQVLGGLDQWRETFRYLAGRAALEDAGQASIMDDPDASDEDEFAPRRPPSGAEAQRLSEIFEAVVARVMPPLRATLRERVAWVEALIGADPSLESELLEEDATSLYVVTRAIENAATAARDIAALRAFKDILRGLVLADAVLGNGQDVSVPYGQFVIELVQAVENVTYTVPVEGEALLVASALEARGLAFDAVALLGLAEGDFPQAEREDTLLRDADRVWLAAQGLAIEPSLQGDEATFFYQAVTRARRRLLLTRPYLADDGQPWEPSPYWSAVRALFTDAALSHARAADAVNDPASTQEHAVVAGPDQRDVSAALLAARAGGGLSPWNGDLSTLADELARRYGADQPWSSSRLETYARCPLYFWTAYVLDLEPREAPRAGFNVLTLGSIYHAVLERLYKRVPDGDPERLRAELPAIARQVYATAPQDYGFRPTPLWQHQQDELTDVLRRTLDGLIEAAGEHVPLAQELPFGLGDRPPLILQAAGGPGLRLRGYIDRIDRAPDGRLRVIDYKAGSTPISARDLAEGRRLQLPLYALAAQKALAAEVAGGFYWHITSARPSSLKLEGCDGGAAGAIETAVEHALAIAAAVRAGQFAPRPPAEGCPAACPATAFCNSYAPRSW